MKKRCIRVAASIALMVGCATIPPSPITTATSIVIPRTILMRGDRLAESKRAAGRGDASMITTLNILRDSANVALKVRPISVMQKQRTPPSGNKHDFMSMAPYWWPDSTKPNGLPFVRRDGVMFPESRVDHDGLRFQSTVGRVETLALAYYMTGEGRYAEAAGRHLRVFFLDTATRMNPNLNFAQAVLGVNNGRGIGIIDTRNIPQLVDAIRLLEGAPGWTARDAAAMENWCREYLKWLLESANGKEERVAQNNHGVFYDVQVAALALYVGDSTTAKRTIGEGTQGRIASQIQPDGQQPLEVERTRPLHYSVFNLDAWTMLAEMGRHAGIDLWHYAGPSGGSIETALRYLAPYADRNVKFPKPDIEPLGDAMFVLPLRRAAGALGDSTFTRALRVILPEVRTRDFSRFAFPALP